MNEKDFSITVARHLDGGLADIDSAKLARLCAARQKAMTLHREPVWILGLASVSGRFLEPSFLVSKPLFWLPLLTALVVIVTLLLQPQATDDLYDESGMLDAKLLTSELPIDAFLDKDFATWVKEKQDSQ